MKFEKGQSGNPKGKPKETKLTFNDLLLRNSVKAYKLLWAQLKQGEPWAFKIYFTLLFLEFKKNKDLWNICTDTDSESNQLEQLYSFWNN